MPVSEGTAVTLWFDEADGSGCSASDDNSGKNFRFVIH
ncbi:MAG: DUF6209 family protein [Polyangiaceae bacterium]